MRSRATIPLVLLAALALCPACVNIGSRKPLMVESILDQARRDVDLLSSTNDWIGARRIGDLALRSAPDDARLLAQREETPAATLALLRPSWFGSNSAHRIPLERPLWQRVALWLPDRVLDLFDVVSFDVAFGIGLWGNVHVTRALQLGGGARTSLGVGWHDGRSLGKLLVAESGVTYGSYDVIAFGSGTSDVFATTRISGFHDAFDPLYQDWRDYWAVGADVHALLLGVSVDVHPLEIADFVTGLVGFDLLDDDTASTRAAPAFDGERFRHMIALQELTHDDVGRQRWRAWLDERAEAEQSAASAAEDPGAQ